MFVEERIGIDGSKEAIWSAITDIDHAADILGGVEGIEVLERPADGLVGLRWRETRMLFGKPATAEKRITEAVPNEYYRTSAADGGFLFLTTLRIADGEAGPTLISSHDSRPQGLVARLMSLPMPLFKGAARKAIMQDLIDIKSAVERSRSAAS